MNEVETINLKTINGAKKTKGMVTLKIKIYNIEKTMNVFVVDNENNFNYEFLIGLDCIKNFKLIQNENLQITQSNNLKLNGNTSTKENIKQENNNIPEVSNEKYEKKIFIF